MTTNSEDNLQACVLANGKLVAKTAVPFAQRTMYEVPQESGVYMFSDVQGPLLCYYVGRAGNFQSRLLSHWDNNDPQADLCGKLIDAGIAQHTQESRKWIKEHVAVRWLTSDEIPMGDAYLEHFLIAVLQPRFNKP